MHLPKSQHKIMLLYARLMELQATHQMLPGVGYLSLTEDKKRSFIIHPEGALAGQWEPLRLSVDELKKHCAVRKPQTGAKLAPLDEIVLKLFPGDWSQPKPVSSDPVSLTEFGARIGLERGRSRYIIDYIHASELPTYSSVTQKAATAQRFAERYGGLYYVYRHDLNDVTKSIGFEHGAIARATLSIRYPVPYKPLSSARKGERRIRCKLTLPGYGRQRIGPILYDGYVGTKGPWHQFLFQARRDPEGAGKRRSEDLILMYTEALADASAPDSITRGVMLTQNQETDLTPTVSSVVIARQRDFRIKKETIKRLDSLDAEHHYLRTFYKLIPEDESRFMNRNAKLFKPLDPEVADVAMALFNGWSRLNVRGLHC